MRLDKFIATSTQYSRSQVKIMLRNEQVDLNHIICRDPKTQVKDGDTVCLNGEEIRPPSTYYVMLNKPLDFICSHDEGIHERVFDLLPVYMYAGLHCAGRLDIDTTGLVLLSNDGQWSHRITSPKHKLEKTYLAKLDKTIDGDLAEIFAEGVLLNGEHQLTAPAKLEVLDTGDMARLTITEGRYHQVKRMFASQGYHVEHLHRERIGNIALDQQLGEGEFRELSEQEVASIFEPSA